MLSNPMSFVSVQPPQPLRYRASTDEPLYIESNSDGSVLAPIHPDID